MIHRGCVNDNDDSAMLFFSFDMDYDPEVGQMYNAMWADQVIPPYTLYCHVIFS